MNSYGVTFHHLGLATKQPELARVMLTGLGYGIGKTVFDPEQNVNLALCEAEGMPAVEMIFPATDASPLDGLLATHSSGLVYHLCFVTRDLPAALRSIEASGLNAFCVQKPKPAILFRMQPVSFYLVNGFGLIEILEE